MSDETISFKWYSKKGVESDVIICSKVKFSRNLASFPFPQVCSEDEKRRIQSLIFDAFSKLPNAQNFYLADVSSIEEEKLSVLQERALLKNIKNPSPNVPLRTGLVFKSDEDFSCSINYGDHLRFSFFDSGLSLRHCFEQCKKIDDELQNNLQFAASYDFGYLTATFRNVGSGMKLSVLVHLPSAVRSGKMNDIVQFCKEKKLVLKPAFIEQNVACTPGNFFIIETSQAQNGSEIDQLADFESSCRFIAESERKIFADLAENKMTLIKNSIIRAYSLAKTSLLVSFRESLDMISDFRIGLKIGLLTGITEENLNSLMYDVQKNYILYMTKICSFSFEVDIKNNLELKMDRLRAVILQESLEKLSLGNL